jgi:hypothetical protein
VTRTVAIAIACAVAAAACGDDAAESGGPVTRVVVDTEDRAVVAEVNGRPVFGDCVERQAAAHGLDARAALQECIDFELLAQEAEARGYADDPEVAGLRERESVRALLRRVFEPAHADPGAIAEADVRRVFDRPQVRSRYDHPEYRWAHYVRAPVPRHLADDAPEAREAERRIRAIHHDLAGRRGITFPIFTETVDQHRGGARQHRGGARQHRDGAGLQVTRKAVSGPRKDRLELHFAEALFAIPEVGMVSAPTRTLWGWDLLLLTRISPEVHNTFGEAQASLRVKLFPLWRSAEFMKWSAALAAGKQVRIADDWPSRLPSSDPLQLQ